jgi:hypothetical protein
MCRFSGDLIMTQLLLFEAPSVGCGTATPRRVEAFEFPPAESASRARRSVARSGSGLLPSKASADDSDGVQRIGDLARLVLMRYDMLANRRTSALGREA